jgi:catechol 2,3-dioxygenase-like lactoylglutathione lyase family enzyme
LSWLAEPADQSIFATKVVTRPSWNTVEMTDSSDYYIPPKEQLVLEIFCSDLVATHTFYTNILNFRTIRSSQTFIVLQYEDSLLYLCSDVHARRPAAGTFAGNIRIMVDDVDAVWQRLQRLNIESLLSIADRDYGLRDFTVVGPEGIAIRFGSRITGVKEH